MGPSASRIDGTAGHPVADYGDAESYTLGKIWSEGPKLQRFELFGPDSSIRAKQVALKLPGSICAQNRPPPVPPCGTLRH